MQDEVQGFHWNNLQCTLHPVVCYFKPGNDLDHASYCIISDDNGHDVPTVYEIPKKIISDLKIRLPNLENVEYFSDGCAAQYKNRKNFINLCMHQSNFGLYAKWSFFATSHGKQPRDGIGGTVKRLASKKSLQQENDNHILTPSQMFKFCQENIEGINFIFISKQEIETSRNFLKKRFDAVKVAVPGTRSFHQFVPLTDRIIRTKRCSEDDDYVLTHNLYEHNESVIVELNSLDYFTCLYEQRWWVGIILEVDTEQGDAKVKFMHPAGPARSFYWPDVDDICFIPNIDILMKVDVPTTTSGRQYTFKSVDIKKQRSKVKQ